MIEITETSLDLMIEIIESYHCTLVDIGHSVNGNKHLEPEVNLYEYLKGLQADNNRNNQGEK